MMFDRGDGPPLVIIPGVQGRWEWMKPALRELQKHFRTITYSLSGDLGSRRRFEASRGFDNYTAQLEDVYERCGIDRAVLCGVSYGGFVAIRYAARHPGRVAALVLTSSPAPGWSPTDQQQRFIANPWRSMPAFVATAPGRLWPEIQAGFDTWRSRMAFTVAHAARVLAAPAIPSVMAGRVTLQQQDDFGPDCARVVAPTLIVTGEEGLDRIVPVHVTRRYLTLIPGTRHAVLEHTGHLGMLMQPARFAAIVTEFAASAADGAARRASGARETA
jgi:pimeloyl-ACP methyl ester carboxylesterase